MFDGETNIQMIKDVTVTNDTEGSCTFTWKYDGDADGFNVTAQADRPYPNIPPKITSSKNITIQLAPGAWYRIFVRKFKILFFFSFIYMYIFFLGLCNQKWVRRPFFFYYHKN